MAIDNHNDKSNTIDFQEVERLVYCATSAQNKAEAKQYIQRLQMLPTGKNFGPPASIIFGDLICSVKAASGQVSDKTHWLNIVEQDLYKLKTFCRTQLTDANENL